MEQKKEVFTTFDCDVTKLIKKEQLALDLELYKNSSLEADKAVDDVIQDGIQNEFKDPKPIIELAKSEENKEELLQQSNLTSDKTILGFVASSLNALNELEMNEKPKSQLTYSNLFKYMVTKHQSIIPPFLASLAYPKTVVELRYNLSLKDEIKVKSIINDDFGLSAELLGKIKNNEIDLFTDIIPLFNEKVNAEVITRCSLPIVEIFLKAEDEGLFGNAIQRSTKDAVQCIRTIMYFESSGLFKKIFKIEDSSIFEAIKRLIPIKDKKLLTPNMFGVVNLNRKPNDDTKTIEDDLFNGIVNREGAYRHNLIIFESLLLTAFFTNDRKSEGYCNLSKILAAYVYAGIEDDSKDINNSEWYLVIKAIIPTLFRLVAYDSDNSFVDSLSGSQNLTINMSYPTYNFQDIYGMTFGLASEVVKKAFDENITNISDEAFLKQQFLSHNPKTQLTSEQAKLAWNDFQDLQGFRNMLFDNNISANMVMSKDKTKILWKVMYGFTRCLFAIVSIPTIIKEAFEKHHIKLDSFKEILHFVLKCSIAYPVHFTMRQYRMNDGFKDSLKLMNLAAETNQIPQIHAPSKSGRRLFKLIGNGKDYVYVEITLIE